MKVSLIIPTLNESMTIAKVISLAKPFVDEIIVVDGHSQDETVQIARAQSCKVFVQSGSGKGQAIREAVEHCQHDVIVFMDADASHDPNDIPKLLKPIMENQADHVGGSRLLGGSDELHGSFSEFFRLVGMAFITTIINLRFGTELSDSQNGFRAIKRDVFNRLGCIENSTTIEQEMILKTLRLKYRLVEVATHESKRAFGESSIRLWRAAPRYLYSLVSNLF